MAVKVTAKIPVSAASPTLVLIEYGTIRDSTILYLVRPTCTMHVV